MDEQPAPLVALEVANGQLRTANSELRGGIAAAREELERVKAELDDARNEIRQYQVDAIRVDVNFAIVERIMSANTLEDLSRIEGEATRGGGVLQQVFVVRAQVLQARLDAARAQNREAELRNSIRVLAGMLQ